MEKLILEVVPIDQLAIVEEIRHMTSGLDQTSSRDTFVAFIVPFVLGASDSIDSFMAVCTVVEEQQQEFGNMEPVQQLSPYQ